MSSHDITRSIFDPQKRYSSVRMQQGRVIIDDDWNENERIENEERRRTRADIIGSHGTSDNGFYIEEARIDQNRIEFAIRAGSYYIEGTRFDLAKDETYQTQTDWLQQALEEKTAPPEGERIDLVYLEGWEQSVSAVEDSELMETALGGADTSGRMRVMRRVRVMENIETDDCGQAWLKAKERWIKAGNGILVNINEVTTKVNLKATFTETGTAGDLCTPAVTGGYLGAENQALRVQLREGQKFTWGYDNASTLYRVVVNADGKTVSILNAPKDQTHWPGLRHVVEILPWAAVLPNGEKVAALHGHLSRVSIPYEPAGGTIVLEEAIALDFGTGWQQRPDKEALRKPSPSDPDKNEVYYYMRVWDRGSEEGAREKDIAFDPNVPTPVELPGTGVRVEISGDYFIADDYWIIALRPETPTTMVPWQFTDKRPPNGIRRFRAPLGLIHWRKEGNNWVGDVHDCRRRFRPLTQLGTCCTVTVGDGIHSFGDLTSIQNAIKSLPASGGEVCVLPGEYTEHIDMIEREGVKIRGCGSRTVLMQSDDDIEPVIRIQNCTDIAIESLCIIAKSGIGIAAGKPKGTGIESKRPQIDVSKGLLLRDLLIQAGERSAIEIHHAKSLRILDSTISIRVLSSPHKADSDAGKWPAVYISAIGALIKGNVISTAHAFWSASAGIPDLTRTTLGGLQIGGRSKNVEICNNRIIGGIGNGITLGSISYVTQEQVKIAETNPTEFFQSTRFHLVAGSIHVGPTGCIEWTDDPEPPTGPGGEPLVPMSDGILESVKIVGNEIGGMGGDGIGVAFFFDLTSRKEVISVVDLLIEKNTLTNCVRLPHTVNTPQMTYQVGHGGVSLASAERVAICNNVIEANGQQHEQPVCGVFILYGQDVLIEGNRIVGNGCLPSKGGRPVLGHQGGIVISYALPLSFEEWAMITNCNGLYLKEVLPRERMGLEAERVGSTVVSSHLAKILSYGKVSSENTSTRREGVDLGAVLPPSVRVQHNLVESPQGPSLKLRGTASAVIQSNEFVRLVASEFSIREVISALKAVASGPGDFLNLWDFLVGAVLVMTAPLLNIPPIDWSDFDVGLVAKD